jgi:uncharacterized protein DUF2637
MRTVARVLVIVVGIAAMILSFHGLTALAVRAGVPVALAWLYPVMTDTLAIVAALRMASAVRGSREWNASAGLLAGALATSVVGNVAASIAGDLPWIAPFIVTGLPPIFVLLTAHQALGAGTPEPRTTHNAADPGPAVAQHVATYSVPMAPAVAADGADPVAALVGAYTALGGSAADPQLTRTLASAACVDERTARRRLEPYRSEEADE